MAKVSTSYVCQQCAYRSPQFLGRCPQCQAWGSLVEMIDSPSELGITSTKHKTSAASIVHLKDIEKGSRDIDGVLSNRKNDRNKGAPNSSVEIPRATFKVTYIFYSFLIYQLLIKCNLYFI